MEKVHKPLGLAGKKRKRKISDGASESKTLKLRPESPTKPEKLKNAKTSEAKVKKASKHKVSSGDLMASNEAPKSPKKNKKSKVTISESKNVKIEIAEKPSDIAEESCQEKLHKKVDKKNLSIKKSSSPKEITQPLSLEEISEKYPVLNNKELVTQFLQVPLTNNQKGRIRQAIKMTMHGAPLTTYPDLIHAKIQNILQASNDLTDSELRRIRILYNMLKTSLESPEELLVTESKKKLKKDEIKEEKTVKEKGQKQKVKGPKRYVVFLGNLPLDINKEKIMNHFRELNESIKDIRIPKPAEGKKSAIAFVELMNEPSFELALSKNHSMLGSKRINVLYTAQKDGKISTSKAKGKSAKLIALQKSGKLLGSTPMNKKRSHRRNIMKKAKAEQEKNAMLV